MPANPNLPSLKGSEASLPGDYLNQKIEIELLNSIGLDPRKYMLDMSQVEGQVAREKWEDFKGNNILRDFVFERPQPGESEAPRKTYRHTRGLGTDPVTRNMRRRGLAENKMKLTKQQLKQIVKEEMQNVQEEKSYPNPSTMRKLVKQAKMDGRYKEEDVEKLKKAYDKHVRGTLRDPKHSQAHRKKVNETQLDVVPIDAPVEDIIAAMKKKPSYLKGTIIYQLNAAKKMGYEEKAQRVIDALGWTEEAANDWSAK
jgi:hypothetical protein